MLREDTHRKIEQEAKSDSSMHENYIHVLVAKMIVNEIFNEHEAQMKAKDEEIERLKAVIDTSIEEIEYAIKKPQYAEVYLGNAIRFLKDNE